MKATITYSTGEHKPSMFAKPVTKYHVTAKVTLTEEEQAIVAGAKLGDVAVHEYDVPLDKMDPLHVRITIDDCLAGKLHDAFDTPIKARQFADKLTTDILPSLKNYIEGNRPLETEPMVIEL